MQYIQPNKLKQGDTISVIAPSHSSEILTDEIKNIALKHFDNLGLKVVFGKNINQTNKTGSSSVENRLKDLHDAFEDKNINGIIAVRGGYHSNDLLPNINWELIKNNPKVFCGFSDITALNNAILAKTNLITYSGPNFINFGQKHETEYMVKYFIECLMSDAPYDINSSITWNEDNWWANQDHRMLTPNEGVNVFNSNKSKIEGTILGGNLSTLNLLQGTGYLPTSEDVILFIEDDELVDINLFIRMLQALLQQKELEDIRGICIGRFKKESNINVSELVDAINEVIIQHKVPIITNLDFGHTNPQFTIPIGGHVEIDLEKEIPVIKITNH